MSASKRVQVRSIFVSIYYYNCKKLILILYLQQWATFSRMWYLFDAQWQDPFHSAKVLSKYLTGMHKPIYHPQSKFKFDKILQWAACY